MACIYIGSYTGIHLTSPKRLKEEGIENIESMTTKDAYMFPVYGSMVLFGLYLIFKFIDKSLLNPLFTVYFTFLGVICLMGMFEYHLESFIGSWKKVIVLQKKLNINLGFYKNTETLTITKMNVLTLLIALVPSLAYLFNKNWFTNNIVGIAFSISGI